MQRCAEFFHKIVQTKTSVYSSTYLLWKIMSHSRQQVLSCREFSMESRRSKHIRLQWLNCIRTSRYGVLWTGNQCWLLASSPDAMTHHDCCCFGCVNVKCPFSHTDHDPCVINNTNFHLSTHSRNALKVFV